MTFRAEHTIENARRLRLYETILSNTADLVYVFDLDHRLTFANDTLLSTWHLSMEEALGTRWSALASSPEEAARYDAEIRRAVSSKAGVNGVGPFGTTTGRVYHYTFVPVRAETGAVEAVAGTARDVTDAKRAEEQLREANRRRDEFIALLAHELRNPLAPLVNGLQVIKMAESDVSLVAEVREMMDRQLSHLVRLMDDLLDASRITRNKLRLEPNSVALGEVVSAAVEAVRPVMEEKGHRLSVSLPSPPVELRADGERLSQVLQNLLRNSAKYTQRGGEIRLTCRRSGAVLEAVVEDSGIGISSAELPGIFDLFARSDRAAKEDKNGLGIGLALAKGLIEMHGGSIVGESAGVDKGSRFTITLPLGEGYDSPGAIGEGCGKFEAAGDERRRGRRVLVVDDNTDLAASMARMLSMLGHEVQTAADGIEGLKAAELYRPDVVFMDIGMPRLDGLEATRRLRAATWGKEIPVVALTGWGQDSDRLQSERAGCDRHLVKPVRLEEVERLLEELRPVAPDVPSSA